MEKSLELKAHEKILNSVISQIKSEKGLENLYFVLKIMYHFADSGASNTPNFSLFLYQADAFLKHRNCSVGDRDLNLRSRNAQFRRAS
jgi:hypothetical protein